MSFVLAEPNAETLPAFAKWVQQQKVHSKFNLAAYPGAGLGGVARVDIKENDTLIMYPYSAVISNEQIKEASYLKDFKVIIILFKCQYK